VRGINAILSWLKGQILSGLLNSTAMLNQLKALRGWSVHASNFSFGFCFLCFNLLLQSIIGLIKVLPVRFLLPFSVSLLIIGFELLHVRTLRPQCQRQIFDVKKNAKNSRSV